LIGGGEYVVIPESQHAQPLLFEPRTDWMLTTELVATQPLVSQRIPQERLSVGLPLPKFASSSK
jgi:hypothetical protein